MKTSIKIALTPQEDRELRLRVRRQKAAHRDVDVTKLACEMPDNVGRCPSLWTCAELARTLVRDGVVDTNSPQTAQRILQSSRLKPWRVHHWRSMTRSRNKRRHRAMRAAHDSA